METYPPRPGDLVFFEHDVGPISRLVAGLSGPPIRGLKVSHCAIVAHANPHPATVMVIENTLKLAYPWHFGDPLGGGREWPLASICDEHGAARRLLVIRRGQSSMSAVNTAAAPWLTKSDYSIPLLLLAGLASLHRGLPCAVRSKEFWETVHLHARAIVARAGGASQHVGTCAGTLAEIECSAGQDLDIREPSCPGWLAAWRRGPHVIELIGAMAELAWLEAHVVEESQALLERVTQSVRAALDRYPEVDLSASLTVDESGYVRFGPGAAGLVLNQLQRVLVFRRADKYRLFRELLITFHVLDELLHAQPDGGWARSPGQPVYLPLMPLDLILKKFEKQLRGPYQAYGDP